MGFGVVDEILSFVFSENFGNCLGLVGFKVVVDLETTSLSMTSLICWCTIGYSLTVTEKVQLTFRCNDFLGTAVVVMVRAAEGRLLGAPDAVTEGFCEVVTIFEDVWFGLTSSYTKNALVREKWYERFTGILKRYTGNLLRNLLVELGKRAWNTHEERCKRFKKR